MVQFYSTDGKYSNIETFASDSDIKSAQEEENIAKSELDQAKKKVYDALQSKQITEKNLDDIKKKLEKTIKDLDSLVEQSRINREQAIEDAAKATSEKNAAIEELKKLQDQLLESQNKNQQDQKEYENILQNHAQANEDKEILKKFIGENNFSQEDRNKLLKKEADDIERAQKISEEKKLIVEEKEKAVNVALASEEKAIAERATAFTQLEKEELDYVNLENRIEQLREEVKKSYASLKEKTVAVAVLKGRLDEAGAKAEKSRAEAEKLEADKNILRALVNEEEAQKEAQEKELELIRKKEVSLSADKTLLIAEREKATAVFNAAKQAHYAAIITETEANKKFDSAKSNHTNLITEKDENLKDSILGAITQKTELEKAEKELQDIALKEQQEKLKIAKDAEEAAEQKRKKEEEELKKLLEQGVDHFSNTYEYNKGEDCFTTIIVIMIIILIAGLYTGIIKRK